MGAKKLTTIGGFDDLVEEHRQFIRQNGVSHHDTQGVQELTRRFKQQFSGVVLDWETMRTILRHDQRRRRRVETENPFGNLMVGRKNPPLFRNNARFPAGS